MKSTSLFGLLIIVVIGCLTTFTSAFNFVDPLEQDNTAILETIYGSVQGLVYDNYAAFLGIPFAAPPVGPARWQSPIDPKSWAPNVLDARNFQAGCPQMCELPPGTCPNVTSEDCLYLNVFVPLSVIQNTTSSLRPVMAFLPGGRFEQGSAASTLYIGDTMVSSAEAIVVTINYRLGALGFLLTDDFTGNFGFQDQRQALYWIQNNAKFFGGDANQVTLVGQSAGATSIATHITSPLSFGLFHRVIVESDPWTLGLKTQEIAQQYSLLFANAVGCSFKNADCLLALTVDQVLLGQQKAQQSLDPLIPLASFLPWTPTIDGDDIIDQPLNLIKAGKFYQVPMIVGSVSEEALIFIYQAAAKNVSALQYEEALGLIFLNHAPFINDRYPPIVGADNRPVLSTLGTDYIFVCPVRNTSRYIADIQASNNVPIYNYQFQHVTGADFWGPNFPDCVGHVCHGSELLYVWNSAARGGVPLTDGEQQLSINMNNYWMNFVVNGDPNVGLPVPVEWPTYNTTTDETMIFQTPPFVQSGLLKSQCDYLDEMGYDNPR
ncbi:putative cholinesterase [Cavenderia fasciculata]|uniref:Carboxylic ester hydrolase n=1 Tax=Cavenderia fasciculata TaxID=261658 RepID=F4PJY9_CACFS|nr:putative cholinesterase [Cavenderia fasciculata]EGG23913.1 putative cholinesterase [Cavenderia fasciculata]|eukprot:XP_004361764.1 putative cholinesterase [Cavenderia fasciculata]